MGAFGSELGRLDVHSSQPSRLVEVPLGCGFAGRVRGQAPASALNRLFSTVTTTQTGPPRPDPPQGEATAEIEPIYRATIRDRTVVGGGEGRIT